MDKFLLNLNNQDNAEYKKDAPQTSGRESRKRKYRKYDDSYLDFGSTSTNVKDDERSQCVLCMKILVPEYMFPSELKRHLKTNHSNFVGKPCDFFTRKLIA